MRTGNDGMPTLRSLLVGAAIAVAVGVVGSYLWRQPAAVAVLSGGAAAPVVETPKDEVVPVGDLTFKWRAGRGRTRLVVVDLSAPDRPIVDRVVDGDEYQPGNDERGRFVSGRQYHWYVEAQTDGASRASTAAQFTVR
jgi:hypothetical protein